jgi:hypothetical protein
MASFHMNTIDSRSFKDPNGYVYNVTMGLSSTTINTMVTVILSNMEHYYHEHNLYDEEAVHDFISHAANYLSKKDSISVNAVLSLLLLLTRNKENRWSLQPNDYAALNCFLANTSSFHEIYLPDHQRYAIQRYLLSVNSHFGDSSNGRLDLNKLLVFTCAANARFPMCLRSWVCMDNAVFVHPDVLCHSYASNCGLLELFSVMRVATMCGGPMLIQSSSLREMNRTIAESGSLLGVHVHWSQLLHETKGELLATEVVETFLAKKRLSVSADQLRRFKEYFHVFTDDDTELMGVPGIALGRIVYLLNVVE